MFKRSLSTILVGTLFLIHAASGAGHAQSSGAKAKSSANDAPKPDAASKSETPVGEPVADPAKDTDKDKDKEKEKSDKPAKPRIQYATFGAGCFWSTEAVFERLPGVTGVVTGFSGGNVPSPSYEQVCTGQTGHAEAVHIEFDSKRISYESLLNVFFHVHDPTTLNRQGPDYGTQYRSVIFFHDEDQKAAALKMYKDLTAKREFRGRIVTQLVPFDAFFPAEAYHQDYARKHPTASYTQAYILPKLRKAARLKIK